MAVLKRQKACSEYFKQLYEEEFLFRIRSVDKF